MCSKQGLSQQTLRASFWHPDPRKIPIFSSFFKGGGGGTLSFGQNFLKIIIASRYFKKSNS